MTGRTRAPAWVVAALLAVALAVGWGTSEHPAPVTADPSSAPTTAPPLAARQALALLEALPLKGRAPRTGYARSAFGRAWADVDGNGCRTRDDVLARDLQAPTYRDRCVVVAGVLLDPYTHERLVFRKEDAAAVQIDHVVALADAWQKGAQQWSPAKRLAFANDPLELLAVGGSVNERKSDADAASWLPPYKPFRCAFVTRQVQVKARYGLWVTAAERDAMRHVLARCR